MSNNKQQTAVEWLWEIAYNRELTVEDWKQAKEMEKEQRSIELPSDEEIEKESFDLYANHNTYSLNVRQYKAFKRGAKWMRDKIRIQGR
jgi:predicted solute-binding protein